MTETQLTRKIITLLRSVPNSFVYKVHGGAMQMAGLPDVFFCCDTMRGRAVWFEIKVGINKPTALQNEIMRQLRAAGCEAFVVYEVSHVAKILEMLILPAKSEEK